MKYFNIYYKGRKLNNRPLTEEEKNNVQNTKEIYKRTLSNNLEKINTSDISFIKTILI